MSAEYGNDPNVGKEVGWAIYTTPRDNTRVVIVQFNNQPRGFIRVNNEQEEMFWTALMTQSVKQK